MKRTIGALLAGVVAFSGLTAVAPTAGANAYRGNWDLFVGGTGCTSASQDQAWCGTGFVVRANLYVDDDDLVTGSMRLIGSNGDIPLKNGGASLLWNPRVIQQVDPTYKGQAFESRAATGQLAPGNYGLILTITTAGRWSCSIYSKDVCNWQDDKETVIPWFFEWTGTDQLVPVINVVTSVRALYLESKKSGVAVDGVVIPNREGIPIRLQKRVNGKWKTLGTKNTGVLGFVDFVDRTPNKTAKATYRMFAVDAPTFALKVTERVK
jgi:hypothetical protein